MLNNTEDTENLEEKLKYLGLNLARIPKILKQFESLNFKSSKSYDETSYKVYKHIQIGDIEILLTPTDRLTDFNQKYKLAMPLENYLDSKSEKNVKRFATFLQMLNNMNIEEIEKIEEEQEKLKENLPYEVKYPNNYIWQIYYSDVSDKYFMLVTTNETNNNAFFYLIKKKIECNRARKKETIFVPITHQEHSEKYFTKSQMTDIENYLWYFTKEWPNIYEVYDLKEKMTIKIVGITKVYESIKSNYVITFATKEEALQWYKLIKALFIISTALPNDYEFQTAISDDGSLEFCYDNKTKIEYEYLPFFIQNEFSKNKKLVEIENRKIATEEEKLNDLKQETERQTQEFLNKQRQIATFLDCKKTFFGKVKYYFTNRKKHMGSIESHVTRKKKTNKTEKTATEKIEEQDRINYTIEDLIEICTKLEGRRKIVRNLEMDRKALELKKINLERKIKNANIYLNEIELHKKSIFEFWKFANKDELPSLNEGEEEQKEQKEKLSKSFVFEEDIEALGKQMDEIQRRKLSKKETDSIFAIKQVINSSRILNNTKSKDLTDEENEKLQQELDELKNTYEENFEIIQIKDFNIFGGISEDKTKLKTLNNTKHRETKKDKYKVLNINSDTELALYIDNLRNDLNLVQEAFHKISSPSEMTIYIAGNEKFDENNLNIANLNATETLNKEIEKNKLNNIDFYSLVVPKDAPLLYYTNIIYYDNLNQTLPLGLDVDTDVLIDLKKYKLNLQEEKEFRINYKVDAFTNKNIGIHVKKYILSLKK